MEEKHSDIIETVSPVIKAFEELGIVYYISGSIASSAYGVARATMDVDMVCPFLPSKVKDLIKYLENDYYIDELMILSAIKNKSSFNLIHLKTMIKVDVFITKQSPYDQKALERRTKDTIAEADESLEVFLASAEDIILSKLNWFRMGGEISEKQWNDILGVVKVQKDLLDYEYIKYWAKELNLLDLVERAL